MSNLRGRQITFVVVFLFCVGAVFFGLGRSVLGVVASDLMLRFSLSKFELGAVSFLNMFCTILGSILIRDMAKRRIEPFIIAVGLCALALGFGLTGLAINKLMLFAGQSLVGLSISLSFIPAASLMGKFLSPKIRGRIAGASISLATLSMGGVAWAYNTHYDVLQGGIIWFVLAVVVSICIVVYLAGLWFLGLNSFRSPGSAESSVIHSENQSDRRWGQTVAKYTLYSYGIVGIAQAMFFVFTPNYMHEVLGGERSTVGFQWLVACTVAALGPLVLGFVSDRKGPITGVRYAYWAMSFSLIGFFFAPTFLGSISLFAFGHAALGAVVPLLFIVCLGPEVGNAALAKAIGLNGIMWMFGPPLGGAVIDFFPGSGLIWILPLLVMIASLVLFEIGISQRKSTSAI